MMDPGGACLTQCCPCWLFCVGSATVGAKQYRILTTNVADLYDGLRSNLQDGGASVLCYISLQLVRDKVFTTDTRFFFH